VIVLLLGAAIVFFGFVLALVLAFVVWE